MKNTDWRAMNNGRPIPTEAGYCDQPSVVRASDGTWVCTVTTGKGAEGAKGQYVSITRSADQGRTWTEPVSLEETDWESAYSSLALAPSGRIYCFYCYNLDRVDIERVPLVRYDMGGYYCYRYSEDNGVTWSDRHIVPVRDFETDEKQAIRTYNGKPLRFFWNVSRVFFEGDDCYSALIKYTYRPDDVLHASEGVLLRCAGLDRDPDRAAWETLPDGKRGLRAPQGGGRVSEEQSYVMLSDGTIFAVYRTIDGHPACALSRDGGHTFQPADYVRHADGRPLKHNRAATFLWPLGEGQYLYWFNNQGLKDYRRRNPIWCALATETPSPEGLTLSFSEPELLLYHESEHVMMSYPDLLWDGGWFVTETQKVEARIHPIDPEFMRKLRAGESEVDDAPVFSWRKGEACGEMSAQVFSRGSHDVPGDQRELTGAGLTLSLWVRDARSGETLFSTWTPDGGLRVALDGEGRLGVCLGDVMANCMLSGSISLADGGEHHLALIVDSRACVAYAVADGRMDDGGERAACGWRWLNRAIVEIPGGKPVCGRSLVSAQAYGRALMTLEAASLYRKGCPQ